jgi:hypothetical protein
LSPPVIALDPLEQGTDSAAVAGGDENNAPATADDEFVVFVARK